MVSKMIESLLFIGLIVILGWSALQDIESRLISNRLSFLVFLLGIFSIYFSEIKINLYLMSFLASFALGLAFFYFRIMGGGDVKLFWGLGVWFPWPQILELWWMIFLVGGFQGLYYLIRTKSLNTKIPYALPIFLGTGLYMIWIYYPALGNTDLFHFSKKF
jgi:Flp pilus assembly protein protease CpaA